MQRSILAVTAAAVAACSGVGDTAQPTTDAPAAPTAAALEAPATPLAPKLEESAYITGTTGVRREPSDERELDDPAAKGKKKKRPNVFVTLHRGEEVTITGIEGDWAKVRTSDEQQGWVKMSGLLRTADVQLGTVFSETKRFRRPDLLALNTDTTLEAGTLLYVLRTKDQFSEVNIGGSATTWLLSESVSTDSREVSAAKLLNKIRSMQKANDAGTDQLIELAKSQFSGSRVLALLDGAAAPAEGGAEAQAGGAQPEPEAGGEGGQE